MNADHFGSLASIEVLDIKPGFATARMTLGPQHLNGLGAVHGGAIFTLADVAFAAACNADAPPTVAINASISFLKAAKEGMLHAEAKEVSFTRRIGSYHITVTDDAGDMIASFQGLAYRKQP